MEADLHAIVRDLHPKKCVDSERFPRRYAPDNRCQTPISRYLTLVHVGDTSL